MSFAGLVRSRLTHLGLGQKDLARAAEVTDSYISQLLSRKKAPPAPNRTDIYAKMERFLKLGRGELGRLAEHERAEEMKRKLLSPPEPLFQEFRDLALRKCIAEKREEVRSIFGAQPFGTLERLVTQALLEVLQGIARQELESENWMRLAARVGGRSHEEMRVIVLEFLDTDIFRVSLQSCIAFVDPLVHSWDIDLKSFRLEIVLNRDLVTNAHRTFCFVECTATDAAVRQSALDEFLADRRLSGDVTEEEIVVLQGMPIAGRRPNKLYYYRALQNLRDRLLFTED